MASCRRSWRCLEHDMKERAARLPGDIQASGRAEALGDVVACSDRGSVGALLERLLSYDKSACSNNAYMLAWGRCGDVCASTQLPVCPCSNLSMWLNGILLSSVPCIQCCRCSNHYNHKAIIIIKTQTKKKTGWGCSIYFEESRHVQLNMEMFEYTGRFKPPD
jgi:hypothetical protein